MCIHMSAPIYIHKCSYVCIAYIHTCTWLCMHMWVCSLRLQLHSSRRSQLWKRRKMQWENMNPSMTSAQWWRSSAGRTTPEAASPGAGHAWTNPDTQRRVRRSCRVSYGRCSTFNDSKVPLCRDVAKLFFPNYLYVQHGPNWGREGVGKKEILISWDLFFVVKWLKGKWGGWVANCPVLRACCVPGATLGAL